MPEAAGESLESGIAFKGRSSAARKVKQSSSKRPACCHPKRVGRHQRVEQTNQFWDCWFREGFESEPDGKACEGLASPGNGHGRGFENICVARGIEVTLIPGHGSEHSTGNPTGLWLHGGPPTFVWRGNHRRRLAACGRVPADAAVAQQEILESEDAGRVRGRQHARRVGATRSGAPFHPPAQHPPASAQAQMDHGTLQHTGVGIRFRLPKAGPASPHRQQP